MEKLFYPLLCIRQNPPRQPTTFTLLAAAAATASHCHSRRSPFFGGPKLSPGTLELQAGTRCVYARTRVDGTRSRMILGGREG